MQAWIKEKQLHVGAEATVTAGHWLGIPAVMKVRNPREWRHPDLDLRLTTQRMNAEVKILNRLSYSRLPTPHLLDIDTKKTTMITTLLDGKPLVEILRAKDKSTQEYEKIFSEIGTCIRRLHRIGITHGDLTTNNMLWDLEKGISLVDFGLAKITYELEHYGLDFHLMYECFGASHPEQNRAMEIIVKSYLGYDISEGLPELSKGGELPLAENVIERFEQIKTRVRYHG